MTSHSCPNSLTSEHTTSSSCSSLSDTFSHFSGNSTILDSEHTLINDEHYFSSSYPPVIRKPNVTLLTNLRGDNTCSSSNSLLSSLPRSRKSSESSSILEDLPVCSEHHLCKDFFCSDCVYEVCVECIKQQHTHHYLYPGLSCKQLFEETDKEKVIVRETIAFIEKNLNNLQYRKLMAANNIKTFFQHLRELVDHRETELLNEVAYLVDCRTKILEQKLKENQEAMSDSNKMMERLAENFRNGDNEYVTQNSRYAKKQLEILRSLHKNLQTQDEDVIFYPPDDAFLTKMKDMGRVACPNYMPPPLSQQPSFTCSNIRNNGAGFAAYNGSRGSPNCNDFTNNSNHHNMSNANCNGFANSNNMTSSPNCNGFSSANNLSSADFSNGNCNGFSNGNCNGVNNTNNGSATTANDSGNASSHFNNGNFGYNPSTPTATYFDNSPQYNPFQAFAPPPLPRSPAARALPSIPASTVQSFATALAAALPTPSASESPSNFSMLPFIGNPIRDEIVTSIVSPLNGLPMDNPVNMFPVSFHTRRNYARIKKPVTVFGKEGSGDYDLCRPWGVCCDNNGHVIIADRSNNRIQIFRSDGSHVRMFGQQGSEEGEFNRPAGVAIDYYGRIVVTDKDNHRVQVFTMDGDFVFAFGERGTANGKFHYPWDVDVNASGIIAVSDTRNHRIQLFTGNGIFIKKFGFENMSNMWKFFDSPRGLCFTPDNTIMVTDFNNHRLYEIDFAKTPKLLHAEDYKKCELFRPQGLAMDAEGNILVADCRNNRIQVFTRLGDLIGSFGVAGKELGQFDRPSGIALTPDGKIVIVDFGNHRIQIF